MSEKERNVELELGISFLEKTINGLMEQVNLKEEITHNEELADSLYDPDGFDFHWRLEK